MKIENKMNTKGLSFCEINEGEAFACDGIVYMKTSKDYDSESNSVRLSNGCLDSFDDDDLVVRLDGAKLVIE